MDVRFVAGEADEITVRGHRLVVDQPADAGGQDSAPTPTEPFVASLATCVAFYAGRFLTRHGYDAQARLPGLRPCGIHSAYQAAAWSVLAQRLRIMQGAGCAVS